MDISLVDFMEGQLKQITSTFHRYMYDRIGWESRMFGLVGPRGVGKSTMILQFIKEKRDSRRMFYVSADHLYFSSHTLVETVDEFAKEGCETLAISVRHFSITKSGLLSMSSVLVSVTLRLTGRPSRWEVRIRARNNLPMPKKAMSSKTISNSARPTSSPSGLSGCCINEQMRNYTILY